MKIKYQLFFIVIFTCVYGCETKKQAGTATTPKATLIRTKPQKDIVYHFEKSKNWLKQKNDAVTMRNVIAINRTDSNHLRSMDSILVPNDGNADIAFYLPFPLEVHAADSIDKILLFSYPAQAFAAYENGVLVYCGPTNMGRRTDPTPTGLYFTNWKAEKTTSTFDDEWELKWNFNIDNKEGIGFHQYELPGYPASHSCLRLQEADARFLYDWADQWVLAKDTVRFKGTPVIVFGSYDFKGPKPWLQLTNSAHILDIPESGIAEVISPYLKEIHEAQEKKRNNGK